MIQANQKAFSNWIWGSGFPRRVAVKVRQLLRYFLFDLVWPLFCLQIIAFYCWCFEQCRCINIWKNQKITFIFKQYQIFFPFVADVETDPNIDFSPTKSKRVGNGYISVNSSIDSLDEDPAECENNENKMAASPRSNSNNNGQ